MSERVYLKNLHGFRFIAALFVMVSHLELFKARAGLPNIWRNPFIFEAGTVGVDFFFVLSGFLITTLLLKEHDRKGSIALGKFYMRRILRIWPLYYLVFLLCYLVIPYIPAFSIARYSEYIHQDFLGKFFYSLLFMPNVALAVYKSIPYAAPLWSVGVEEQFYLFWPVLLFVFPKKLRTIVLFIAAFIGLKVLLIVLNKVMHINPATFVTIKNLVVSLRMECMGIGGLGAYLFHSKHPVCKTLTDNRTLIVALVGICLCYWFAQSLFELHHIIFSLLFLVVIMNGALNPKTPINLENRIFFNLGNISYGIYLWHCLWVGLALNIALKTGLAKNAFWAFNLVYYALAVLLSILVSWLSYTYYESWFLKRKEAFTVIQSGASARTVSEAVPEAIPEVVPEVAHEVKRAPKGLV